MRYANFQGTQFRLLGLANNPPIAFPESGPGAVEAAQQRVAQG